MSTTTGSTELRQVDLLNLTQGSIVEIRTSSGSTYWIERLVGDAAQISGSNGSSLGEGLYGVTLENDTSSVHVGSPMIIRVNGLHHRVCTKPVTGISLNN